MFKAALHYFGTALARPFYGGRGCIVALHRVVPEAHRSHLSVNRALEITPGDLERIIQLLISRGFEFVSMDSVLGCLTAKRSRRFAAFTLDDGYRDNVEHALPVFAAHQVPFTIYATRGFSEGRDSVWWSSLEEMLMGRASLSLSGAGGEERFSLADHHSREGAFNTLARQIRRCGLHERDSLLTAIFGQTGIDPLRSTRELILTSDELRALSKHPLVTFGAHTIHHLTPNVLDETSLRHEFEESKSWLEELTEKPVRHLAYPFGGSNAVGAREFSIAQHCGFATAVTTRFANLFPPHRLAAWALPRIEISGNYEAGTFVERAVSGLLPAIRNRGRRVVIE